MLNRLLSIANGRFNSICSYLSTAPQPMSPACLLFSFQLMILSSDWLSRKEIYGFPCFLSLLHSFYPNGSYASTPCKLCSNLSVPLDGDIPLPIISLQTIAMVSPLGSLWAPCNQSLPCCQFLKDKSDHVTFFFRILQQHPFAYRINSYVVYLAYEILHDLATTQPSDFTF